MIKAIIVAIFGGSLLALGADQVAGVSQPVGDLGVAGLDKLVGTGISGGTLLYAFWWSVKRGDKKEEEKDKLNEEIRNILEKQNVETTRVLTEVRDALRDVSKVVDRIANGK